PPFGVEPAAGLDPEGRDSILSAIKRYHKDTGTTVLLVSHSMEDIARYADKVLVMAQKKVAMYDTVEKVFARAEELLALGLSVPQDRKSTRLNSSHVSISYAVFCWKKKTHDLQPVRPPVRRPRIRRLLARR